MDTQKNLLNEIRTKIMSILMDKNKNQTPRSAMFNYTIKRVLSYHPRVTVTSCFVYKAIRDYESIDHLFINPIRRIGLIHK